MTRRRRRLVPLLAAAGLVATACGRAPAPGATNAVGDADAEKALNVYNWSDYMDESVLRDFETETGIRVTYDVFDSNEVLETKLLAGNTGYDVVVPSASFLERQVTAGVFREVDRALLPNLQNMDPRIMEQTARHDPGNAHSIPYLWGTSGIGYDAAAIAKRMPDAPLDSWRMFYDPAVVSRFADCGVTVLDAPSEVVGTVLLSLGRDANSEDPADLEAAEAVLMRIRSAVRYVHSSRYIEDLANGEVCLSLGWSGDVLQARRRSQEAGKAVEIRYAIPREGAIMFFDMLAIPRDAPHPRNAHRFIDYLMRPEIAARNSSRVRYANGNAASMPLLDEAIRNDQGIYPPPEAMARLVPDLAESAAFTRRLNRTWTRFKSGH